MSDFEKEMRKEKIITVIVASLVFGYLYLTTNDTDVGTAKLLWVIMFSTAYLIYRINKLEELIIKIYSRR